TVWTSEQLSASLNIKDPREVRMEQIHVPLIEISSRDLRRRASEGRSLLYATPRAVEVFIREKKLYQEAAGKS
ncbi:MAG: nicotinate (nicotinamide) nucleotide adenylyltransferase, partial [Planctomycetes bacterium]|nr:nicotinate (nicotinamide) nucleotide adenylyltransferase [Planctomycetota bacterium]